MTESRIAELERRFGDPWDQTNPVGHAATVDADERGEVTSAGEQILDGFGLNHELVPVALGGRFRRLDDLIELMRVVFRRDAALGLGYSGSSLIAGVNVWAAGDEAQRNAAAGILLGNGRMAAAYHELAHGNDLNAAEMAARRHPDGSLLISGRKEVIGNVRRAAALVLFARTSDGVGGGHHSLVFAEKTRLAGTEIRYLPRYGSSGLRGLELGGIELRDCRIPATAVVGNPGHGAAVALRSFQLTRIALPAMATGCVDTGLRTALRFVTERVLYGGRVCNLPYVRAILAEAFVDLLVCECLSAVAARVVHLRPDEASLPAAATKFLLPHRLTRVMYRLSTVLGAHFYFREGRYAIFQKHLRDLAPLSYLHAGGPACLATIVPQLPRLARRTWEHTDPAQPEAELFRLDASLPELRYDELRVTGGGRDAVTATLADPYWHGAAATDALDGAMGTVHQELAELARHCAEIPPAQLGIDASAETLALAVKYVHLLAAAACLNVWRQSTRDDLLGDPAWVRAALLRIQGWSGRTSGQLPDELSDRLFAHLMNRYERDRSFGVSNRSLSG
jgi:alkylation response protein AidB-like acyl-CoA dehydrogenase